MYFVLGIILLEDINESWVNARVIVNAHVRVYISTFDLKTLRFHFSLVTTICLQVRCFVVSHVRFVQYMNIIVLQRRYSGFSVIRIA